MSETIDAWILFHVCHFTTLKRKFIQQQQLKKHIPDIVVQELDVYLPQVFWAFNEPCAGRGVFIDKM